MENNEYCTILSNKEMVLKSHPRIKFRGKLDSLVALVLLVGNEIGYSIELTLIRNILNDIVTSESSDIPMEYPKCLDSYRDKSHNIGILESRDMYSKHYAYLNYLRTQIRETEIAAIECLDLQENIIKTLNRLSSLVHCVMSEVY